MKFSTISMRAALASLAAIAALQMSAASAMAATVWQVVPEKSRIAFSGTHAGRAFTGTFQSWQADIAFDPNDLANSKALVTVDLASAVTGDATYDKTLPTADWFNISAVAQSTFVTTGITTADGGKTFTAEGNLSIRGVEVPVTLAFSFTESGNEAQLEGTATLKRLDFGIGKGSDAEGAWVSLDIPVTVSVALKRAP